MLSYLRRKVTNFLPFANSSMLIVLLELLILFSNSVGKRKKSRSKSKKGELNFVNHMSLCYYYTFHSYGQEFCL